MTYNELGIYGKLRKNELSGPFTMYKRLLNIWPHVSPDIVNLFGFFILFIL